MKISSASSTFLISWSQVLFIYPIYYGTSWSLFFRKKQGCMVHSFKALKQNIITLKMHPNDIKDYIVCISHGINSDDRAIIKHLYAQSRVN